MTDTTPNVIFSLEFYPDGDWNCGEGSFLDYMQRPEAFCAENHSDDEFKDFLDYMGNEEKSDGIFDISADLCSEEEIEKYREYEAHSHEQKCCRYIGVMSFRNEFLKEHGILSDNGLDNKCLKDLARSGMSEMIHTSAKLEDNNVYWYGAIHSNTDNIHVHFSVLEYEKRNRKYDKLEVKSFDALKSKVVNKILGSERTIEISNLAKQTLLPDFERNCCNTHTQLIELYNKLPKNQTWQYGRDSFEPYRKDVNNTVDSVINSDPDMKANFEKYSNLLDEQENEYKKAYGIGQRKLYADYKSNKLNEFYTDAGNKLLNELKNPEFQKCIEAVREDVRNFVPIGYKESRTTEEKNKEIRSGSYHNKKHFNELNWEVQKMRYDMSRLANETEYVLKRSAAEHDRHINSLINQYDFEEGRRR